MARDDVADNDALMAEMQEADNQPEPGDEAEPQAETAVVEGDQAPVAEGEAEGEGSKRTGDPGAALREERQGARELREELARNRQEIDAMRMQMMQMAQQQQPVTSKVEPEDAPEPKLPKFEEVGLEEYLQAATERQRWAEARQAKVVSNIQAFISQEQERSQRDQHTAAIGERVATQEAQFRQVTPDYDDATRHLVQGRIAEITVGGLISPERARRAVKEEIEAFAGHAIANRRPVPELIYQMAKARGYQAPPAAVGGVASALDESAPRGASSAARNEAALASASGALPKGGNTLQALIDASDEDIWEGKIDARDILLRNMT